MEALVGRAVRKMFPGFGAYAGVVESYDADAGYFRVLYEDGDSEEVDADEMAGILVGPAMPEALQRTPPRDAAGRRPKKRRRGDEESPSSTTPPDGVLLVVPAADGASDGETEPATPAEASAEVEAAAAEKKRRVSPGPVSSSRPLRRSARQAKAAERAAEMEAAAAVAAAAEAAEAEAAAASTPQQSGIKRPRANGSGRYRSVSRDLEEAAVKKPPPKPVLPPKPELPPSSQGLDLGGLPVLDVFQVYSCLRSFSRQLFLSPFPLDTFVAALHCAYVNPLVDWVHFALLRALKSHLEDFANEGDPSAVHCIRNLNWELLDLATWPIYLAEYLLTRGTELRYGMKLTDLKLLSTEYYTQPAVVKLELLRSLSDDVLEIGAIRSRMSESDGNDEGFRSTGLRRKKRGSSAKGAADSSQSPAGSDEMDDGNSDECYLCGMDGNLLCCDGCPAAFHSKCVGAVEDLLPEGDWIDSYEGNSPCHYYGQVDLHPLVTVLSTCHPSYSSIVNAISSFCGTAIESTNLHGRYQSSRECSTSDAETNYRLSSRLKQRSEHDQSKVEQDQSVEQLDSGKACTSNSDQLDEDLSLNSITFRSALISRRGNAAEGDSNQIPQNRSSSAKNDNCNSQEDVVYSHANGLYAENQKESPPKKKQSDWLVHSDLVRYINYYSFGQIAASAAEELKHKLSENKEGKKPVQDALSFHLRTICKKYANIFALTDQKLSVELLKEKCGWCNSCQISGGVDCIFRVTDVKCMEGPKPHTFGLGAEKNMESHIILATHNILSIEERLNGLLTGPWQNPQYSTCWRKEVLKASDVSSLKQPLLMLESSLRRVAISVEWQKPADSVEVVGSAAHILVRSSNKSLSHGSARKPGRKPSSNGELKVDSRDVGVYWWRGGKLSRQVFHWKRLPQSLVYKAARQAGRRKIPTILYTDGSQFARRFKYIAWRAAVEMAENVARLILQIKELEWNIKWTEILSTLPSSHMTKETQKIARLFKKVIIRRKRTEGTNVEYLLDFGKRENIPPVISKHGTKFEEPSSERNRYWLTEGHVPLNLLKAYEAKAFARLLKRKETDELPKKTKKTRDSKPKMPKKTGFAYLFERAEKQSTRLCGHCNKEVAASEAVNCQYCADWFHGDIYSVTIENVNNLIGFKCHRCRLRSLPVCPYAQTESDKDHGIKFVEDEEHSIDKFVEDEEPNFPKDLGAHGSQKDLHDHSNLKEDAIEKGLNGHIAEKELSDNNCQEELNDHSNLKDVDTHSTEKELDDDISLKELDVHNELKELDSPGSEKELGSPGSEEELGSPGSEKEPGEHNCLKEINNHINMKDLDSCRTDKELKNHNCLNELDGYYNWKGLDDHNNQGELDGTASSKFAAEETQCPMELNGLSSLKLVSHNNLEELNNHNCPKESDNKSNLKELDINRSPEDSGDFLAEHFNNIRISSKEALAITPETGSVEESLALQSKDDSEKTVPAEHEIDLQVVVTL
ncbi:DDT domain-containing protein PTM [Dichanthelium oligosanthes]|uniref:DDT domain-containing protein PTM n=1 Tax=Dichanthelium oligosanthes TaxID=888268 RepID=A0A1E5W7E2_9POAL|nr:DDT domain-containing protein PTM [Dichanthelium oligosanthes]